MRLATLLLLLCLASPVRAATVDGVSLPDAYPADGRTLVLNGMGIRRVTVFNVRAYVAGLYLTRRSGDAAAILASPEPKVVLMQFLHAASKSQVEDHYREGAKRNCGHGECAPTDEADFERLVAATPAMAVGDTLTFLFNGPHVRVLVNNRPIADVQNADLGQHLLAGFIGPRPPAADLKAHMLGAPN